MVMKFPPDMGLQWGAFYTFQPPVLADFAGYNDGDDYVSDEGDYLLFEQTTTESTANLFRGIVKNAPATPYTVEAVLAVVQGPGGFVAGGMAWLDSVSGKAIIAPPGIGSSWFVYSVGDAAEPTEGDRGYFGAEGDFAVGNPGLPIILRFSDDGTTKTIESTVNGLYYKQMYSGTHADYITPDKIGIGAVWTAVGISTPVLPPIFLLLSWKEEL